MCFINCSGLPTTAYFTFVVTASDFIQDSAHSQHVYGGLRVLVTHSTYYKNKNPRVFNPGALVKNIRTVYMV
jgi:molybdopterin biosynthesis enzyme